MREVYFGGRFYFVFVAILVLSCSPTLTLEEDNQVIVTQESIWLESLCSESFMGRKVGTLGNKRAFTYLCSEIRKMGIEPTVQEFVHKSGDTLRNILAYVPGEVDSCILIGSHFDGQYESTHAMHYPAANDNASGVVTNLLILDSLTNYYRLRTPYYSYCCAFWDGEEAIVSPAFKGSQYFVTSDLMNNSILLYINIDTVGYAFNNNTTWIGYNNCDSWGKEIRSLISSLSSQHNLIVRDTPWKAGSDDATFIAYGLPTVSITDHSYYDIHYPLHTTADTPDKVSLGRLLSISNSTYHAFNRDY